MYQEIHDFANDFSEWSVFSRERDIPVGLRTMYEMVASIRAKYKKEFEDLTGVVAEYDGEVWLDNIDL